MSEGPYRVRSYDRDEHDETPPLFEWDTDFRTHSVESAREAYFLLDSGRKGRIERLESIWEGVTREVLQ